MCETQTNTDYRAEVRSNKLHLLHYIYLSKWKMCTLVLKQISVDLKVDTFTLTQVHF